MRPSAAFSFVVLTAWASFGVGCSDSFSTDSAGALDAGTGGKGATASNGGSTNGNGGALASNGGVTSGSGGRGTSTGGTATGGNGTVTSNDGSVNGGREGGSNEAGPMSLEIDLTVQHDTDDATWINGDDERLEYSTDQPWDEVGADTERGRAGFRFEPQIPPGSVIESAVLRLRRLSGEALDTETLFVQVFESASVPPFDDNHVHPPSGHVPEGLSALLVSGFVVGANDSTIDSPDLSTLVQHVVSRPDWTGTSSLGFVLSPDNLATWVAFADASSGAAAAQLRISYVPPQR